jgi:uncharacterized protein (TIGR02145 family)
MEEGLMVDSRDGQTYKTIKIGDQVWMGENLNYETDFSFAYEGDTENCEKYGRFYTWEAAIEACPPGWHLPTEEEFKVLLENVGGEEIAGKMLKSTIGWKENKGKSGNGIDKYGFNAIPAGSREYIDYYEGEYGGYYVGGYCFKGMLAGFWSGTELYVDRTYCLYIENGSDCASM